MENISQLLSKEVTKVLQTNNISFKPGSNSVIFIGNHGIDYGMNTLISICKSHSLSEKVLNISDLVNMITSQLELDPKLWNISFVRNNLNFNMTPQFISEQIKNLLKLNNVIKKTNNKKKILVDFSSPNIAKDMHVGHLRSTIIGDCISRLFEELDHEVHRINHIGDFGLQFGMLIQYLYEENINFQDTNNVSNLTISDLQDFYAKSKKRFDNDENFKGIAYQRVVELQSGNEQVVQAWEFIKSVSRQAYNQIYERLNIHLEEVGESFYQSLIPDLINELKEKGLLEEDNGRQIVKVPGSSLPLTVIKTDGGFTYDTTDLAAVRYRLITLGMEEVYYVVDSGQATHFNLVFEVAKMAGWLQDHHIVKHIGFGLVLGDDGKRFRSRDGDTVKLVDLLDEALIRAKEVISTKEEEKMKLKFPPEYLEEIVRNVGYGSIKYSDLASTRTNDYVFSFDKMLSLKGNTAPYLLYAYVRICSIMRNAGELFQNNDEAINNLEIIEKEEIELCRYILTFPEVIEKLSKDLLFHSLSSYLYKLSEYFNKFFMNCRCLHYGDDRKTIINVNNNRLLLCEATRKIMKVCFDILGIKTLDRM